MVKQITTLIIKKCRRSVLQTTWSIVTHCVGRLKIDEKKILFRVRKSLLSLCLCRFHLLHTVNLRIIRTELPLLPPAYVVRREGNSFTLFVCPHRGGVRVPPPGGYPGQVPPQGYPGQVPPPGGLPGQVPPRGGTRVRYPPGGTRVRYPPGGGGTRVRYPPGGYPGQVPPGGGGVPGSGTPPGSTWVRYPPGGVPGSGTPGGGGYPGQVPPRGGYPGQVPPPGGYPGRTTEGVLTTRRAVCLLRSRRRTFLLQFKFSNE